MLHNRLRSNCQFSGQPLGLDWRWGEAVLRKNSAIFELSAANNGGVAVGRQTTLLTFSTQPVRAKV
jgi:hypothetical protein